MGTRPVARKGPWKEPLELDSNSMLENDAPVENLVWSLPLKISSSEEAGQEDFPLLMPLTAEIAETSL